jgi:orotate phosphoribosyltransferase
MTNDLELLLREAGALKEGHFLLASGLHSNRYIEKFDLLRNPAATVRALEPMAAHFSNRAIDVVAGPTTGGVILAFELARQLGAMAAYAERTGEGRSGREFRRGTQFAPESRVLVVDDILTTGGSIRETLAALAAHPVKLIAIAVLVDRSGGSTTFPEGELFSLLQLQVAVWEATACPLCAQGAPLTKPGTTTQAGQT